MAGGAEMVATDASGNRRTARAAHRRVYESRNAHRRRHSRGSGRAHGRAQPGAATIDSLDGHAFLVRLKIAALLAIIDRRLNVTGEDWALAEIVMRTSDAVRRNTGQCQREGGEGRAGVP